MSEIATTTYLEACSDYERHGRYLDGCGGIHLGSYALVRVGDGYACIDAGSGWMGEADEIVRRRYNNAWRFFRGVMVQAGESVSRLRAGRPRLSTAPECGVGRS